MDEVAVVPTKRMRNKIAGFLTHLMRRIQRGPVRGISLKLQEEEREKKLDYVPDTSFIEKDSIEVDQDTKDLLDHLNIDLPAVSVAQNNYYGWKKSRGGKHNRR
jgi:small subunit ribosomal protein S17e